jgi:hypothetical protein
LPWQQSAELADSEKKMSKDFVIDPEFLSTVNLSKSWNSYAKKDTVTNEDLLKIIKGEGHCAIFSNDDHPEFKKLREQLGELGYIYIERGWWNGDRVLKPFTLNGARFKKHDQFCSGAAIKFDVESRLSRQRRRKSASVASLQQTVNFD